VVDQSDPASLVPHDSRVRHLPTRTRGKTAALNIGIAAARADLLAFTDDDCTVPPDWLQRVEALFARYPEVALAFGVVLPIAHDPSHQYVPEWRISAFEINHRVRHGQARGGGGGNMAARRTVFEAIGPWDEQIGPGSRFQSSEEGDIIFRALTSGQAVARVPDLTVTHWGVRSWADGSGRNLKRSYAYGRGAVIGKHLRLGNRHMVPVAAREIVEDLWLVARALPRPRQRGLGEVAYKWRGLADGLVAPVDRSRRLWANRAGGAHSR
jgi:glycosyltransferase involved in cell wall biosynthesis